MESICKIPFGGIYESTRRALISVHSRPEPGPAPRIISHIMPPIISTQRTTNSR
jgi:hypothetical protein